MKNLLMLTVACALVGCAANPGAEEAETILSDEQIAAIDDSPTQDDNGSDSIIATPAGTYQKVGGTLDWEAVAFLPNSKFVGSRRIFCITAPCPNTFTGTYRFLVPSAIGGSQLVQVNASGTRVTYRYRFSGGNLHLAPISQRYRASGTYALAGYGLCSQASDCNAQNLTVPACFGPGFRCVENTCDFQCGFPPAVVLCHSNAECGAEQYCALASCGRADEAGRCRPRPTRCTREAIPTCGCDGRVYTNQCAAAVAGVSVDETNSCLTPR